MQVRGHRCEYDRGSAVTVHELSGRATLRLPPSPTNLIKNEWSQKTGQTLHCRKGSHGLSLLGVIDVFGDGGADDGHR